MGLVYRVKNAVQKEQDNNFPLRVRKRKAQAHHEINDVAEHDHPRPAHAVPKLANQRRSNDARNVEHRVEQHGVFDRKPHAMRTQHQKPKTEVSQREDACADQVTFEPGAHGLPHLQHVLAWTRLRRLVFNQAQRHHGQHRRDQRHPEQNAVG